MNYSQRIDDIIIKNINMTKINFTLDNNFDLDISNEILKSENLDLNNRLNEITRLVYCQDWNKLHKINKKIKVEEFFSQLILKNDNYDFTEIQNELINRIENKNLNKKDVQYDKINGRILDILCLNKDNNKFYLT